jgi:hypothetical protein
VGLETRGFGESVDKAFPRGSARGGTMKSSGIRAKKTGTRLKRGAVLQLMCYPRPRTKAALVEASQTAKRSLSSFILTAALKEAASIGCCEVEGLVPADELEQYHKSPPTSVRVDPKRSAAAKRALDTIRAKRHAAELRIAPNRSCAGIWEYEQNERMNSSTSARDNLLLKSRVKERSG